MADSSDVPEESHAKYFAFSTEDLVNKDVKRDEPATSMAEMAIQKQAQEHEQREKLLRFVLRMVTVAMIAVVVFVGLLLIPGVEVHPTIGVAFITAVAVQSFAIVGFIARGLYPSFTRRSQGNNEEIG